MIELYYTEIDGLLYPDIENNLGNYGILRLQYLHEYKPALYWEFLLTDQLAKQCADIDSFAFCLYEQISGRYWLHTDIHRGHNGSGTGVRAGKHNCRRYYKKRFDL